MDFKKTLYSGIFSVRWDFVRCLRSNLIPPYTHQTQPCNVWWCPGRESIEVGFLTNNFHVWLGQTPTHWDTPLQIPKIDKSSMDKQQSLKSTMFFSPGQRFDQGRGKADQDSVNSKHFSVAVIRPEYSI